MTSNPPIRSIPLQRDESPGNRVSLFVKALKPHLKAHADQGQRFFARVMGIGTDRRSSVYERDIPNPHHSPEKEVGPDIHFLQPNLKDIKYHQYPLKNPKENLNPYPDLEEQSRRKSISNSVQRAGHIDLDIVEALSPPPGRRTKRPFNHIPTPEILNRLHEIPVTEKDEETESAQRRLARKLKSRARAAIKKPRSTTPPLLNNSRSSRKRRNPTTQEGSEALDRHEIYSGISKKRRIIPDQQISDNYQTKNIHRPNERLTILPSQAQKGFLSAGKASKPIHMSIRGLHPKNKPFDENRFLGLRNSGSVSSYDDEKPTIIWKGKKYLTRAVDKRRRPTGVRAPNVHKYEDQTRLYTHNGDEGSLSTYRLNSNLPPPGILAHNRDEGSLSTYRLNSNLPPPGRTNSPSWPTNSSQISRRNKKYEVPTSVRTLSQVNLEDRKEKQIRNVRQRDLQAMEAQYRKRSEYARKEMGERLRGEEQRSQRHRQEDERRRMEAETARMDNDWRHRLEMEKRAVRSQAGSENQAWRPSFDKWVGEQAIHQNREEFERYGKEIRDITGKYRWKMPDGHPLRATINHPADEDPKPSTSHRSGRPYHPYQRLAEQASSGHPKAQGGQNKESNHDTPIQQVSPRRHSSTASHPNRAPLLDHTINVLPIERTSQPFSYFAINDRVYPQYPPPDQQQRHQFAQLKEQMQPPPIPPRTYLQQSQRDPRKPRILHSLMPPPSLPIKESQFGSISNAQANVDIANHCRAHNQLPPSSSTQRGKISHPALPIQALLQPVPENSQTTQISKDSMPPPSVPDKGLERVASTANPLDIARICRERHKLPPPTPQGGTFGRKIFVPPLAPRQPIF
ncbi:uncharacterized protein I206_102051 [Kwoniella pini CBS 10737]|uniref:Uncharacterized protein n=1 Tax=Kwoniella pini CBS 10737 TaxID=1296096 RepID=A0A1B9HUY7_9TREE|nr:uncharacterized protein I206_06856 [Kwoniella pini CBS 10737]OCF47081.1 hypothetical protein I206_06856 [Kwoniella pini CBS 10737]